MHSRSTERGLDGGIAYGTSNVSKSIEMGNMHIFSRRALDELLPSDMPSYANLTEGMASLCRVRTPFDRVRGLVYLGLRALSLTDPSKPCSLIWELPSAEYRGYSPDPKDLERAKHILEKMFPIGGAGESILISMGSAAQHEERVKGINPLASLLIVELDMGETFDAPIHTLPYEYRGSSRVLFIHRIGEPMRRIPCPLEGMYAAQYFYAFRCRSWYTYRDGSKLISLIDGYGETFNETHELYAWYAVSDAMDRRETAETIAKYMMAVSAACGAPSPSHTEEKNYIDLHFLILSSEPTEEEVISLIHDIRHYEDDTNERIVELISKLSERGDEIIQKRRKEVLSFLDSL